MIHYDSKIEFEKWISHGCEVIELGDQLCDWNEKVQGKRAKDYYSNIKITSIDWAGENVERINLCEIYKGNLSGDIVTDFGTLEHVENLYNGLLNVFNFCKKFGVMIHVNPAKEYGWHGYRWFTEKFWKEYAKASNLELLDCYSKPPYTSENPGLEIYAILRKNDKSKMISEVEFKKLEKYLGTYYE